MLLHWVYLLRTAKLMSHLWSVEPCSEWKALSVLHETSYAHRSCSGSFLVLE